MELFHEVYGCYYAVVSELLRRAPLDRRQIEALVSEHGYGESVLELVPKLLTGSAWRLMDEREGQFYSKLLTAPASPMTTLECAWLRALLNDPRVRLFLTDDQLAQLSEALKGVEPLYQQEDFVYFDRCRDGDDYKDPGYCARFQAILSALHSRTTVWITYQSQRNGPTKAQYVPLRLEYSSKDDKFRLFCARIWQNRPQGYFILNLGRILDLTPSPISCPGPFDLDGYRQRKRCKEPVVFQVTRERNALERVMVEFSSYEKQSEFDPETGRCTVRLWYQQDVETEVLIRLLGFGPVLRVLGPERFVAQIRERVTRQAMLLRPRSPL